MKRQIGTKILFIFFVFTLACFGTKTVLSFPHSTSVELKNKILAQLPGQLPNSEWEAIKIPATTAGHIVVQKILLPLYLSRAINLYKLFSLENLQIKKSTLLIKDYLSHIYPSHNFW